MLPLETVKEILRGHGIRLAYLFGSQARKPDCDSDLDLAVWWPEPADARLILNESALLAHELREVVGIPVDLVSLNSAEPLLAFEAVVRGEPLLWEDPDDRFRYEQRVRQRYEDFCHIQRFYTQALRERLG